jgi:hypothetical protein
MKITKEFRELFFEAIEKSLKLELCDQKLDDGLTIKSISNALYNDLIEFLEGFKFNHGKPAEEPGFGEEGLIDEKGEAEEED